MKFVKSIQAKGGREIEVDVDAAVAGNAIVDSSTKIRLDWRLAENNCKRHEIARGVFVRIPQPELLAAYKLGALIKRSKAMETGINAGYYLTKIVKDVQRHSNAF